MLNLHSSQNKKNSSAEMGLSNKIFHITASFEIEILCNLQSYASQIPILWEVITFVISTLCKGALR